MAARRTGEKATELRGFSAIGVDRVLICGRAHCAARRYTVCELLDPLRNPFESGHTGEEENIKVKNMH